MTDKVLCRYYLHGACKFGEGCRFSHDLATAEQSQVCRYYLQGNCAYGDRCRYDHVRPTWAARSAGASTTASSSYAAPPVPRPPTDTLADQLPISRLRLGEQPGSELGGYEAAGAAEEEGEWGDEEEEYWEEEGAIEQQPGNSGGRGGSWAGYGPAAPDATNGAGTAAAYADEEEGEWGEEGEYWGEDGAAGQAGGYDGDEQYWAEEEGPAQQNQPQPGPYGGGEEEYWDEEGEYDEQEEWCEADSGEPGGAAAAAAEGGGGAAEQAVPLPLPLPLPLGPACSTAGSPTSKGGASRATAGDGGLGVGPQQQQQKQKPAAEAWAATAGAALDGGDAGEQAAWQKPAAWQAPLSQRSLCMQYLLGGTCAKGADCKLVHGLLCEHCRRYALHPHDPEAAAAHTQECRLRHERLAARARSSGVECSICLEKVLEKADPRDRKFGLMACPHPFCLPCIRGWRQKLDGPADLDSALRTCPVCRTTTHFITPSTVWPDTAEEKERIVNGYKAKLGTIDCKHFAFGEGTCPFGTSCFYRHAYPDGRLEEPTLRKAAVDEGEIKILQAVRLSDYITSSAAGRQLLGGAGGRARR